MQKRASWPSVSISSIQHCSPSSISLTEGFISCPKARGRRRASRIALPGQDDGSGLRLRGRRLVPPMRGLRHRHGRFCDEVPLPGGGFKDCIARERCPGEIETGAENSPLLPVRRALRVARSARPDVPLLQGPSVVLPAAWLRGLFAVRRDYLMRAVGRESHAGQPAGQFCKRGRSTVNVLMGSSFFIVGFKPSLFFLPMCCIASAHVHCARCCKIVRHSVCG